jgi:predicted Zn-dependent peptidase
VAQEVYHHTFPNGLTLLAERMEHVRSAAMNFLVPAGCAHDPPENLGVASVLSDLITRGAGDRDSRRLTEALDNLGLTATSVGVLHGALGALARNLPAALELYADILPAPARRRTESVQAPSAARFTEPGGRAARRP